MGCLGGNVRENTAICLGRKPAVLPLEDPTTEASRRFPALGTPTKFPVGTSSGMPTSRPRLCVCARHTGGGNTGDGANAGRGTPYCHQYCAVAGATKAQWVGLRYS